MNKVPLSSLIGKTPVTVRYYEGGQELTFRHISECDGECACIITCGHRMTLLASDLVEVLPAKETPTPLTDAKQWETDEGSEVVDADFASKLELDRAALLALVERVAKCPELRTGDLQRDARAILAQLKTP